MIIDQVESTRKYEVFSVAIAEYVAIKQVFSSGLTIFNTHLSFGLL